MEISISEQLTELVRFALLGLGLGLLYDMLRLLRYSGRGALLWDSIFCALAGAGCFALSMERGRPGLWSMASSLGAFCLYINFLSPLLLPPVFKAFRHAGHFVRKSSGKSKNFAKSIKKFFTNSKD